MARFNIGDTVLILPKYMTPYPAPSATIAALIPDPFRPMFNEYILEFTNHSVASAFEFQLLEDVEGYETFIATVVFDSHRQTSMFGLRGVVAQRQIILKTAVLDIHMQIEGGDFSASIAGQVLARSTAAFLKNAEITFMKDNHPTNETKTDDLGEFHIQGVPRGSLNIQVVVEPNLWRVVGLFTL